MTYEKDGYTLGGTDPVTALITLQSLGADAVAAIAPPVLKNGGFYYSHETIRYRPAFSQTKCRNAAP